MPSYECGNCGTATTYEDAAKRQLGSALYLFCEEDCADGFASK